MSFLTPLYILGALSVAAPLLFHLIRRTTRGEVPFSSLIFLSPSPPRLTRRSRLDNWFLLLLRALALALLALAFARPFLRQAAGLSLAEGERSRVAILIDTSASMRRGDLWVRAKAKAIEAVASCRPEDQLAVFAFDAATRPVLGFDESATLDPSRRQAVARALVERLSPSWGETHLGQALIDAAGAIEDVGDAARKSSGSGMKRRIVLIGDLQQGSHLEALGGFDWPKDVELDPRTVAADGSNASLRWVAGLDADEPPAGGADLLRVAVSNDSTSRREEFSLAWTGDKAAPTSAYVPPGETRVVRVRRPFGVSPGHSLRLSGDAQEFDNTLYLAAELRDDATILYVGPDAPDDPDGLLYYLDRVFEETPRRSVKVEARSPAAPLTIEPGRPVPLIVLATETSPSNVAFLRRFADGGGTVLIVVTAPGKATTLAALMDSPAPEVEAATPKGDVMLGEIAFDHPLFGPFAGPQFNDFTKIKFWNYRRIPTAALGQARVLARFENGDPAVIEQVRGRGRLVILASGWNPADSQLARSSKFMPLMTGLLAGPDSNAGVSANVLVHDHVPLPEGAVAVRKPDGTTTKLGPGSREFSGTDAPGVYTIDTSGGPRTIAVNLGPSESKTAPLEPEVLEQFGCRLVKSSTRVEAERETARQLKNAELEGRQKLWRPLILAAMATLIVETWLAGWLGRTRPTRAEAPAS